MKRFCTKISDVNVIVVHCQKSWLAASFRHDSALNVIDILVREGVLRLLVDWNLLVEDQLAAAWIEQQ